MNKRNLYIYGDSFGDEHLHNTHPDTRELMLALPSYHQMLRDTGMFNSVTSHAVSGSDFLSQYILFTECYNECDDFIFFETSPDRVRLRDGRFFNYTMAVNDNALYRDHHGIDAVKHYYENYHNTQFAEFVSTKLVNSINERHNVLVIPCFESSCVYRDDKTEHMCIAPYKESQIFLEYHSNKEKYHDIRRNHMTTTNHKILTDMIVNYYTSDSGYQVDLTKFIKPDVEPFDTYFKDKCI